MRLRDVTLTLLVLFWNCSCWALEVKRIEIPKQTTRMVWCDSGMQVQEGRAEASSPYYHSFISMTECGKLGRRIRSEGECQRGEMHSNGSRGERGRKRMLCYRLNLEIPQVNIVIDSLQMFSKASTSLFQMQWAKIPLHIFLGLPQHCLADKPIS